jgi:hypothetical protein
MECDAKDVTSKLFDWIISEILEAGRSAYCPRLNWKTSLAFCPAKDVKHNHLLI